jgi:LPXTG-motif cell wall-anchored protein
MEKHEIGSGDDSRPPTKLALPGRPIYYILCTIIALGVLAACYNNYENSRTFEAFLPLITLAVLLLLGLGGLFLSIRKNNR